MNGAFETISLIVNVVGLLGIGGILRWAMRVNERLTAIEQWARTEHGADFGH